MMIPKDGSWIAPPGKYQDLTKELCGSDPRLRQPDTKTLSHGIEWSGRHARAILIEFIDGSDLGAPPHVFSDGEKLREHICRLKNEKKHRSNAVYILEGLNRDFVGVMGPHFDVHPSMFLEYERITHQPKHNRGHSSLLASCLATRSYLYMNYEELVLLPDEVRGKHGLRCADTGRNIYVTRVNGEFSSTGMVHRKCIFWNRTRPADDAWDCKFTSPGIAVVLLFELATCLHFVSE